MIVFAVIAGLVAGWYLGKMNGNNVLIAFYLFRFRSEKEYLVLYDLCDSEFAYEMMSGEKIPPKNYAEFLLWHQECRPKAVKTFKKYWDPLIKFMIKSYIYLLIIPAILFFKYALYFIIPVIIVHLAFTLYYRFVKHNNLDFCAILMMTLVIKDIKKQIK